VSSEERSDRQALLDIAAEALEIEREAEPMLLTIRDGDGRLAEIAPRAGSAASRLTELRKRIPEAGEERLRHAADLLDSILNHHTWMLSTAMSLVEADRGEQVERERRALNGFGRTEGWLDTLVDALESGDLELVDPLPWPGRIPLSE
jgi:hypothetical protein